MTKNATKTDDYNGWTNWATWHTALMIDQMHDLGELFCNKVSAKFIEEALRHDISLDTFVDTYLLGDVHEYVNINFQEIADYINDSMDLEGGE